jgi:hypothetical protein
MTACRENWQLRWVGSMVALLVLATMSWAAEDRSRAAKFGDYNPADQTVEMFAAMEKGDISVKLIPKDSTQCRVLIENKTDKPLNVKLPDAFAGVPALAQNLGGNRGGGGGGNHSSNRSGNSGNSQNQSTGGGMGGMGGGGMGGGMFNVPPEKVGQLKVTTVCLEHGKREPNEKVPYEIKPLESFTAKGGVRELCESLGKDQLSQRAAQAAAWHLNNGMSWQELAAKQIHRAGGARYPYFTAEEIQAGMKIAAVAVQAAELREKDKPTTPTSSSSSASGK